jgi:BRCT domain type II-containing protein
MKLACAQWSRPLKIMLAQTKEKKQGGVNKRVDAGKISDKSEDHQTKQSIHPKQPKATSHTVDETRAVHTLTAIPASPLSRSPFPLPHRTPTHRHDLAPPAS